MKENELRDHAVCSLCGKKIGKCGVPMFFVVKVQRYAMDMGALQRQQGLTMLMGGSALLAQTMGPNEDLAKKTEEYKLTVCHSIKCSGTVYELIGREMERQIDQSIKKGKSNLPQVHQLGEDEDDR